METNIRFTFIPVLFLFFSMNYLFAQTDAKSVVGDRKEQRQLSSSDYHQLRAGLRNSLIRFERDKKGRVAFLGGSITYNSGWRDSVCAYLEKRFPKTEFEFIAAGIPSMGTTPAAFRLERDVLSKGKVDLLFEEAAVNDASNGRTTTEQVRAMEGIVRRARSSNSEIDIVIMHFVDPDKIASYNQGKEPDVITNHNLVAEYYQLPVINLAKEVTDRINNGEFTWKDDFRNLHPSPFGQGIYARSMIHMLSDAFSETIDADAKVVPHQLPEKLDRFSYDNGHLLDINEAKLRKGWKIDPLWKPDDGTGTRANFVDVPMLIGERGSVALKLKFEGTAIGIAVAAGQDAGILEYRIDKGEWKQLNLFTKWSQNLHLPWYYTLFAELVQKRHLLELRLANDQEENSGGKVCRIRYFYVNRF